MTVTNAEQRRALKQLRKDREKERAARELLEEMQQNVDQAQERASESERSLCRELEWNETAKSIRVWAEKEEDESPSVV